MECCLLIIQAVTCIIVGSCFNDYRKDMKVYWSSSNANNASSNNNAKKALNANSSSDDGYEENEVVELTTLQVLSLPVSASAMLLLIYYYHDIIQYILFGLLVFVVSATLHSLLESVQLFAFPPGKYSKFPAVLTLIVVYYG